tara:strand:- start:577 stop:828 length:252 start_codon:yes stop_codon:yes gene_type:complete
MVPHLYGTLLEVVGRDDKRHCGSDEFIRVKDCVMMSLKRFLIFNREAHIKASEEYLSWNNEYEIETKLVSKSCVETKFCNTSR